MEIKIALAGNPNAGKTTLFNALTGSNQFVGNWPGVTVEKKEGKLKGHKDVTIMDLPGIYSLSPYTLEEVVARNYLINERPDAIINIVDGTNIERNLYLSTQIMELGIPVIMAVNMVDIMEKNGDKVEQAHREYSIATSCVYRWLRQLKADSRSGGQGTQAIPLPQGMNFRAALVAEGYCQEVGFESPAAGKFCRTKGVTLDEIKRFSTWLARHDDDVVLSASARTREQELINKVTALSEEQKQQNRELQRKEKALAEAAALLVLTKKAQAIWGDKEK